MGAPPQPAASDSQQPAVHSHDAARNSVERQHHECPGDYFQRAAHNPQDCAEPVFTATVIGAARPPWVPDGDPRLDALAAGFELLLTAPKINELLQEAQR